MLQFDIMEEIRHRSDEILTIRKLIHQAPEIGNHEFRTADIIEKSLNKAGIPACRILETGISGILKGARPGKTVALRADIDALPVQEKTGADFSSKVPGMMHACGHDVHTAALLGAAMLLAGHRDELEGNVIFIFQPDEEGSGGAERMIRKGVLDGADAIFGAHVSPDLPEGTAGIRYGDFYAAADIFDVVTVGKSAHAAEPEKGKDALAAAAQMTTRLIGLPRHQSDDGSVLTVGTLRAGTARNILSDKAEFSGIVRTHGKDVREQIKKDFYKVIAETDEVFGTESCIRYAAGYPGVSNENGMTSIAEAAAVSLLGKDRVVRIGRLTMMTEDFGCYLREVPGSFYHIGAGSSHPLHSPEFLPTDNAVLAAAAVHTAVAAAFLSNK